MFFSEELLSTRDSGFGLLWLAATLGPRSMFSRLAKRSVLTADISKLCSLIAEPQEPLALRLSSNLMIGVTRVYKVKQEIFYNDITHCVSALKKVVQEFVSSTAIGHQLEMAQPSARPKSLTLVPNLRTTLAIDFDALVADWDEYLNIAKTIAFDAADNYDDEFDTTRSHRRSQQKTSSFLGETGRSKMHTLFENHELVLSNSFDTSAYDIGGNFVLSPSPLNAPPGNFEFNENFLEPDILYGGALGEELEKELGWGQFLERQNEPADPAVGLLGGMQIETEEMPIFDSGDPVMLDRLQEGGPIDDHSPSFSCSLSLQDHQPSVFPALTEEHAIDLLKKNASRRPKRTRLLLDRRIELTDEELKTARLQYLEAQTDLKNEMRLKKLEKNICSKVQSMIWSVPCGVQAPVLADFWEKNFMYHVDTLNDLSASEDEEPPAKRPKLIQDTEGQERYALATTSCDSPERENRFRGISESRSSDPARELQRSSEEPGQGRHMRLSSILSERGAQFQDGAGNFARMDLHDSFFPWDNAVGNSSSDEFDALESGPVQMDISIGDLRASSRGQKGSSVISSQMEYVRQSRGGSSAQFRQSTQSIGEDYIFDVATRDAQGNAEQTEKQVLNLERNSLNFFRYLKMQSCSLPPSVSSLTFYAIASASTSNRHVAAAAFYHCLALATKNMISLQQGTPYDPISLVILP